MNSQHKLSNALALFTTGLLAGTFFYVKIIILPTFWDVSTNIHLHFRFALMQHHDAVFQTLIALSILSSSWFTWRIRTLGQISVFTGFAVLLGITTYLITYFGNIPINNQLKLWLETSVPENWVSILKSWDFFHTCRTATAIGSFLMILIATFFKQQLLKKTA